MRLRYNVLLGAGFSGLFLWLTLRTIDWHELYAALERVRWQLVPVVLLVWLLSLTVRSLRWRALLGYRPPVPLTFHIANIGTLINNTVPFRVGDLTRAYLIGRDREARISSWSAMTTIVTERLADMLAIVLLLVIVLLIMPVDDVVVGSAVVMGAAATLGFGVLLILARRTDWTRALLRRLLQRAPKLERLSLLPKLERLLDGLQPLTTRGGLARVVLWTGLVWIVTVGEPLALSLLFEDLERTSTVYASLALALVTASLSVIVPFTVANVGPFEAATVFALKTGGVPQETALAFAILWHVGAILNSLMWGIVGFLRLQISPREIRQELPGKIAVTDFAAEN